MAQTNELSGPVTRNGLARGSGDACLSSAPRSARSAHKSRCLPIIPADELPEPASARPSYGILTWFEASLLNLQGTELVILSACDRRAPEFSRPPRSATPRGAHAPSRVAVGALADCFLSIQYETYSQTQMWPARAPATAREGACAPQASEGVGLGEDLGRQQFC